MRVRELRGFYEALTSIKRAVSYTVGDINCVFSACRDNPFIGLIQLNENPITAWKSVANGYFSKCTDRQIANEFIEGFGKHDLYGLLTYIEYYEQIADKSLHEANADIGAKGNLYIAIGIFVGVTTAFLVC